jgi:hypothetical protein
MIVPSWLQRAAARRCVVIDQREAWDVRGIPAFDDRTGRRLTHLERLELASFEARPSDRDELDGHIAFVTDLFLRRDELSEQVMMLEVLVTGDR